MEVDKILLEEIRLNRKAIKELGDDFKSSSNSCRHDCNKQIDDIKKDVAKAKISFWKNVAMVLAGGAASGGISAKLLTYLGL